MEDEIKTKLVKAAEFIIETCARETTNGNYHVGVDKIPAEILSPELFVMHKEDIVKIMQEHEYVAEVEISRDGEIDAIIWLNYCPNIEPDGDEWDEEDGMSNKDRIAKVIDEYIRRYFGDSEADDPSWNIELLAEHLADKLPLYDMVARCELDLAIDDEAKIPNTWTMAAWVGEIRGHADW